MSIMLLIGLTCDGCDHHLSFGEHETSTWISVADARAEAEKQGWATIKVFNRIMDFCSKCQLESLQQKIVGA